MSSYIASGRETTACKYISMPLACLVVANYHNSTFNDYVIHIAMYGWLLVKQTKSLTNRKAALGRPAIRISCMHTLGCTGKTRFRLAVGCTGKA